MQDPTEFRKRFLLYKEGKMPYENGLPKYATGTPGLTSALQAALDDMYTYYNPLGYDIMSISGMGGNGLLESGLNPNIVSKSGYAGVWLNNKDLQNAIKDMYGDHSKDSQFKYAHAWVSGDQSIRKGKHAAHTALGSGKFKKSGYKTADEAADAWLKNYERAVILDSNGKVVGYQDLDKRRAYAKAAYDYLVGKYGNTPAVTLTPVILPAVSTAVRNVIPEEKTIPAYDPTISPYISGKPMLKLRPRVQFPNLIELMEDSEWEPGFPGFKNGKLPKYEDGTVGTALLKGGASLIPGVGTAIDAYDFYKQPSLDNLGYLMLSGIGDAAMFTGFGGPFGLTLKNIRNAAKLNKARRTVKALSETRKANDAILLYEAKKAYNLSKAAATALAAETGNVVDTTNELLQGYKNGKSPIHINPANRGKFNATKKRTGKTTEQLAHSSNPLTRKRAIFALNARKWHH